MCSRDQAAIDAAADEARKGGADVLALACDLSDPADIEKLVKTALDRFGRIDVLVTNAGGPPAGGFDRFGDDAPWQTAFNLTLMSAVRLIRAVLPAMRQQGGGAIVAMTSSSVKEPIPNLILSNVMRAGVTALVKTLAEELAPEHIRVNSVIPGRIATQRIEQLDKANAERQGVPVEEVRQQSIARIPFGRLGEPEEFANAVVFLGSEAASFITGAALQVDGGQIRTLW
jgi:3-oxoacyl-[acyl-carrier protein] reductase